jgi:acetyl-CoA carboxylase alpha subunit
VPAQSPEAAREARSIRVVFHELGDAHRQYRLRTGQRVPEALRDAARVFKQAPSLTSLVPVAAFLDEAGILSW